MYYCLLEGSKYMSRIYNSVKHLRVATGVGFKNNLDGFIFSFTRNFIIFAEFK